MIGGDGRQKETMCGSFCTCQICDGAQRVFMQGDESAEPLQGANCLHRFLEYLPRNYPLHITPTAFSKSKLYYFNKFGNRVNTLQSNKITEHFPLAVNIVLYYSNSSSIAHKYELLKENQSFIYLQGYSPLIPLEVGFSRDDESFMDDMLEEKISEIVREINRDDYFNASEKNKQFLKWVHSEYGDEVFCKYMTRIIFLFLELRNSDKFISARLEWLVEKPGVIRLQNVKDLVVEKVKAIKSFQEEYEEKIMEKLSSENAIQVKLFNSYVKQPKLGVRVRNFKAQIRSLYESEKIKVLKNTEKERNTETKTLSDDIARLFLPKLHNYSSLREVLNDEQKFKIVVLGVEPDASKTRAEEKRGRFQVRSLAHRRVKTDV